LGNLSPERIREELYKVLGGQERPSASLRLYERSGVLAALYPELQACVGAPAGDGVDLWSRQMAAADAVPRSRPILRLAALLHGIGGEQEPREEEERVAAAAVWRLMRRLRASNADANRVAHLVAQQASLPAAAAPEAELRRWVRRVGEDFYRDLFRLRIAICRTAADPEAGRVLLAVIRRVRALLRERPVLGIGDLAIGGAELRAAGIPAGPLYGEILRDLLERVTDDPSLNTRERLVEIVERELSAD
ncbi:MAG TPA: hypothetical protein VFZ18_01545, partial [Longimicrobiaceae bacterium]